MSARAIRLVRQACGDPANALLSLAILATAAVLLPALLRWALLDASFAADAAACAAPGHHGACWGVVAAKYRFVLLGRYPQDEAWRAVLAALVLIVPWLGARVLSGRGVLIALLVAPLIAVLLLAGGAGLAPVASELWGGLPLTLLLTTGGMAGALPLGIAIAYGRRSPLPLLRAGLAAAVDIARGIPLVAVLFIASFVLPLLFAAGEGASMLARVFAAIVVFAAVYLSEIIRGGLQALPAEQAQAATALGMSAWQVERHVVLPQVLAAVAPSLANSAIALFKDTSLVTLVSLYELTGSLGLALSGDAEWRPYYLEAYVFLAAIYALGCAGLAQLAASVPHAPR
jgi:general L-amino acid transport system permease protein